MFGQTTLSTPDGKLLARVVVMQPLSTAFFQELKAVLGKDAMIFAGTREVGSTFAQPPSPLQLTPVAPGLFMAFKGLKNNYVSRIANEGGTISMNHFPRVGSRVSGASTVSIASFVKVTPV